MRNLVTVLAAAALGVALVSGSAMAQNLGVGLDAGLNVSTWSVNGEAADVDFDSKVGVRIGGVLDVGLGGPLGLQSGLAYSRKGAGLSEALNGEAVDMNFNVDYLQVPVLLTVTVPTNPSPITPRLYAGPQLGLETRCNVSTTFQGVSGSIACDEEEFGEPVLETKSTDVSLVFGGGLDYALGAGSLTADVRYDLGLTDIDDVEGSVGAGINNRAFSLAAGYRLQMP